MPSAEPAIQQDNVITPNGLQRSPISQLHVGFPRFPGLHFHLPQTPPNSSPIVMPRQHFLHKSFLPVELVLLFSTPTGHSGTQETSPVPHTPANCTYTTAPEIQGMFLVNVMIPYFIVCPST